MTRTSPNVTSALAESLPATKAPAKLRRHDRVEVRELGVHGRGVYAVVTIVRGKKIIEYKGGHITWKEALCRYPHDPSNPDHTFCFNLEDGNVINAKYGGNRTRWISHAYKLNCETQEVDDCALIHALRDIEAGEELFYDYGLVIEGCQTKALKEQFACRCGAKRCRGTVLAPPKKTKKG